LIALLNDKGVMNRGALYASLVCFGDRRVCAILRSTDIHTNQVAEDLFSALSLPRQLRIASLDFLLSLTLARENNESLPSLAAAVAAYAVCATHAGQMFDSSNTGTQRRIHLTGFFPIRDTCP